MSPIGAVSSGMTHAMMKPPPGPPPAPPPGVGKGSDGDGDDSRSVSKASVGKILDMSA